MPTPKAYSESESEWQRRYFLPQRLMRIHTAPGTKRNFQTLVDFAMDVWAPP